MDFHRFAATVGQPKITQKPLLESKYIVPTMEEQNNFVAFVRQSDKSKFAVANAISAHRCCEHRITIDIEED